MFKATQNARPLIALMTVAALSLSISAVSSAQASEDEVMTTLLVVPAEGGAPVLMSEAPQKTLKMRPAQKRSTTHRIRMGTHPEPVMPSAAADMIRAQAASRVDPNQPNRPRMAWPYTARTVHYQ